MTEEALRKAVAAEGYAFIRGGELSALLEAEGGLGDWEAFAASWEGLRPDAYMADGGRYRLRRHAVYSAAKGAGRARPEPPRPHYQSLQYNPLNGGVERWFEPIEAAVASGASLASVLAFGCRLFGALKPAAPWLIEVHQFRILAGDGAPGKPTPEGLHRDGVDYALALLVRRENVASGTTQVCGLDRRPMGSFTLTEPLDAAIVDDERVMHGVTPVVPLDPAKPAYRDVLVATYKRAA